MPIGEWTPTKRDRMLAADADLGDAYGTMMLDEFAEPIRTSRLELVPIAPAFARALVDGDRSRASMIVGAAVNRWLVGHSEHVAQLAIAGEAPGMPRGTGRVVVLVHPAGRRRAIGSVGFHGPPDERGRLEIGCQIDPAYLGRGLAAEAMTALLDAAASRLGIKRFVVSVSRPGHTVRRRLAERDQVQPAAAGETVS